MTETAIFADGIRNISLSNGVLRIELARVSGDKEYHQTGIVYLPANQASNFVNSMTKAINQISEQLKQAQEQSKKGGDEPQELYFGDD